MFFQLLFIHLFRPFLKYKQNTTPLPSNVSPRKILIHAASTISKLLRLYKRTHGLRQICNIAVYISHSACTIHLLNLPDKNAARDIVHGLKHLEEISESWLCARRTLGILHLVAKRWSIEVPEEADKAFMRAEAKYGAFMDHESLHKPEGQLAPPTPMQPLPPPVARPTVDPNSDDNVHYSSDIHGVPTNGFFPSTAPLTSPMTTPEASSVHSALSMPPQSAAEFGNKSRQHNYVMPQAQQQQPQRQQARDAWRQGGISSAPQQTSPTMLFGGVEGLIQDQEWWLRDSYQMFTSWNGTEQGNAGFDGGAGNVGYRNGNGRYGNGNGNGNGSMGFER
jgi:hypothetical protein